MNADAAEPGQATRDVLSRVLRASPFVARTFKQQADWAEAALASGAFERAPGAVAPRLRAALAGADDEAAFLSQLRRFRNRELAWLAFRDIAGWAALDDTLLGLSDCADAAIDAALSRADAVLSARHGRPRHGDGTLATMFVLGMGKLGGRELNFSSDIDLIFGYTDDGDTAADDAASPVRVISNEEYFGRLARETSRLLATMTEDGFVYRVDTMLRPFGSVGAAAISIGAAEDYYQAHGREWERYALIKARPCAGDRAAGAQLLRRLRPFVYRRYLDHNALGHLRDLKLQIDRDAQARGAGDNLKLGPGGIREVEFIVQLFQLTRGGQDARLREPRLRTVLRVLGETGLMPAKAARALDQAYELLRRWENAVQFYEDQQVHAQPESDEQRAALAAALGAADYDAALRELQPLRARVHQEFQRLFAKDDCEDAGSVFRACVGEPWDPAEEDVERLEALGFGSGAADVARAIADLRRSRLLRTLSESAHTKVRALLPALLAECAAQADASKAALRVFEVLDAIAGRSTYLSLLHHSATARRQLVRLCAASPWLTDLLTRTPALLDTLLDPGLAEEAPDRDALRERLQAQFARVADDDVEGQMDLLRRYRQETTLRIAAADLSGALPLVQVSDRLTWLAEAIVAQALRCAWAQMAAQYGTPLNAEGRCDPYAIIGYGKFGSIELGYGSDLDLVFVFDSADPERPTQGGPRSIAAADFFSRLTQRVTHFLSTLTPAGRAYEIDLQLRPSGNSGLVVSSLESFARYQRDSAWTWEHQALLRARPVAGDAELCAAIAVVRAEVLTRPRDRDKLRADVLDMRAKMRANLEKRGAGRWDVKHGAGGLIDAEFITQYLCLREAQDCPPLIDWTDNWRQLEKLAEKGRIDLGAKDRLLAAERAYRGWLHRRALQQADGIADDGEFTAERADVIALWQKLVIGE